MKIKIIYTVEIDAEAGDQTEAIIEKAFKLIEAGIAEPLVIDEDGNELGEEL